MTTANLMHTLIHAGRAEDVMRSIPPQTVALSFYSPPYFVGKSYEQGETFDSWQAMLKAVIGLHASVLISGGFMVVNIADILCFADPQMPRYQAENPANRKASVTKKAIVDAMQEYPHYNRRQIAKMLGVSEQTVQRRLEGNNIRGGKHSTPTRVKLVGHYLEDYALAAGLYLYDKRVWVKDPAWANSRWTTSTLKAVSEHEDLYIFWKPGPMTINRDKLTPKEWRQWGLRGVWHIPSVRANAQHEAQFPLELAERVVRLFSNEGDIVLDPFLGSGTTAIAALRHKRKFLGIEKEPHYVSLALRNIEMLEAANE